jgi:hypothetical protein
MAGSVIRIYNGARCLCLIRNEIKSIPPLPFELPSQKILVGKRKGAILNSARGHSSKVEERPLL